MLGSARSVLMRAASGGGGTFPAPLAAYGFNEGSGLTTADSSGNGYTLTVNGATWATGHTGGGLTNTTTAQGARNASLAAPAAAITMMGWIRPLNLDSGTTHFAFGFIDGSGNSDATVFTQRSGFGTPNILQIDLRTSNGLVPFHGPALALNTWAHIAITYNGSVAIIYVNGAVVSTTPENGGNVANANSLYVAGWSTSDPADTDVTVDDVRIFNSALTGAEITAAMNTPV